MNISDTICAPASGSGGAVALIRVSGPSALTIADKVVTFRRGNASEARGYSLKFGSVADIDDVLVSIFRSPHSYTGEDAVEITCHASPYIIGRILDRLTESGCRLAEPGEFTQRAFVAGKMDLAQAEAVADVIASSSAAEHRAAMNQMRGGYSAELRGIRDELLQLSSLLELELDFSEEEVEFANKTQLTSLCSSARAHCSRLADSFRLGNAVKNGVPVAIVGAPNSGKSTLLNALLGDDRAIVSDVPGTTRDTVEEVCVIDGVKFRFVDTAGLRETTDTVEKMGIERSFAAIDKAQVVLCVIDSASPSAAADEAYLRSVCSSRIPDGCLIVVLNKSDLRNESELRECFLRESGHRESGHRESEFRESELREPELRESGLRESGLRSPCAEQALLHTVSPSGTVPCAEQTLLHTVSLSALKGTGMEELRSLLVRAAGPVDGSETLVTNARHATALRASAASLSAVLDGLASGLSGELLAEDLRAAIASLNTVLGSDSLTPQDTLNSIFSKFCIGK